MKSCACGAPVPPRRSVRCDACAALHAKTGGKRKDTPCSGGCGSMMWTDPRYPTVRCLSCRRASRLDRKGPRWRELRCQCGAAFNTQVHNKKWCSPSCRDASLPVYYRNRTNAGRRGRYGASYRRLRLRVIAEESVCWLCDELVDKARRFPDPLSPSLDHVVALSLGGATLERDNCRLAHLRCNRLRSMRA